MRTHINRSIPLMLLFCYLCLGAIAEAQEETFSPVYIQVMEKLESLKPMETLQVDMGTQKDRYDIGDPFEIRFRASKESYIILMDISSNGDITFISPSLQVLDNKIEAQRVYSTLYDFDLNITIAPPLGLETLNLFCTTEKVNLFEVDFEKEPFYTIAKDDEERLQELLIRLEQFNNVEWSGKSVSVFIGPQSRAVPRKLGALPPIGTTGTTGKFFPPIGATGTTGHSEEQDDSKSQ